MNIFSAIITVSMSPMTTSPIPPSYALSVDLSSRDSTTGEKEGGFHPVEALSLTEIGL